MKVGFTGEFKKSWYLPIECSDVKRTGASGMTSENNRPISGEPDIMAPAIDVVIREKGLHRVNGALG